MQTRRMSPLIQASSQVWLMFVAAFLLASTVLAQVSGDENAPKRGFHAAESYALSQIESISLTSGNLSFNVPMGTLPAGRGGLSAQLHLLYSSKLYDSRPSWTTYMQGAHTEVLQQNLLSLSAEGGWRYGLWYELQSFNRLDQYSGLCCLPPGTPNPAPVCDSGLGQFDEQAWKIFKSKIVFPDGSAHELVPAGHDDYNDDGYYDLDVFGYYAACNSTFGRNTSGQQTFYTVDGTYLRLEVNFSTYNWTLYFPDGSRVTGGNQPQRFYDRNNNYIEFLNITYNGHPAVKLQDQMGRWVILENGSSANTDSVHEQGIGGSIITTKITWKQVAVYKTYYTSEIGAPGWPFEAQLGPGQSGVQWMNVVDKVTLPQQVANPSLTGLDYVFGYNVTTTSPSYGWGELSSITLPTGSATPRASASYTYTQDGVNNINWAWVLNEESPTSKTLTYLREYDGSATQTSEFSTYSISPNGGTGSVTGPDGATSTEWYGSTQYQVWNTSLVYKSVRADGSVVERLWAQNKPYGMQVINYPNNFNKGLNTYVKTEFVSEPNAAGTLVKTAIKDYDYDKNGNVLQVREYDWVNYGDVPRQPNGGLPTGIPGTAQLKRVTVNDYWKATPNATDITTDDTDAYHKAQANGDKLVRAIKSSEVRSGTADTTVLSRTESFYDNFGTTGNVTTQTSWDSTKGAITRPLGAGNSISTTNSYSTWSVQPPETPPTGKLDQTTDAKGNITKYFYDDLNGSYTAIYPTKTIVADNVPAVKRTSEAKYDFWTGKVTEAKDTDNGIVAQTTYDLYARPTVVKEGGTGTPPVFLRQTTTEYSDTLRRVVVRADKDALGDGKLVSIQHYDQLGRVRLSRTLENAATQDPYNEQHGIKVQTHYFAGSGTYPNIHEAVSAPYRAATSGGATSEVGMGWKRTKHERGGKLIELQTFVGTGLPLPWGSNSSSSGTVTTAYDAEFTTVTDQAGKVRRSRVDGLGRLVRVDEPDGSGDLGSQSSPIQPTSYTYNALGNLTTVNQGVQTRTFAYSSLARLTSATNPESGTVTYQYDNNGNLTKKTDARGIWIDYQYDALNRNTTLDYSNTGVNPDLTRLYDNATAGAYGKGQLWQTYAGGTETAGTTAEHRAIDSYDALGRPLTHRQRFKTSSVWSAAYTTQRTYNRAGAVLTQTYPSGRTTNYTYYDQSNGAGAQKPVGTLATFSGNLGFGPLRTYSDLTTYNPQGQMTKEQFWMTTPLYHRLHYNARGQLYDVRLGTDSNTVNDSDNPGVWTAGSWNRGAIRTIYDSNYAYGNGWANNNGNVYYQDHFVPLNDTVTQWAASQDYYFYDSLNRIIGVWEHKSGHATPESYVHTQQYIYDRYGNRTVNNAASDVWGVFNGALGVDLNTNRLTKPGGSTCTIPKNGLCYDAAGNQVFDNYTTGAIGGGDRMYDAENRMLTAQSNSGTSSYTYDAEGRRTRRQMAGSGTVWQIYGIGGELIAEYPASGAANAPTKEYGYRNGQLLVVAESNGTVRWMVKDALGTPRMMPDQTGSLAGVKRRDFLPFGEELLAGVGSRTIAQGYGASSDSARQKFTGKERDGETGLDWFGPGRYLTSPQGRFNSSDPLNIPVLQKRSYERFVQIINNPSNWNAYSYAHNNPLSKLDPNGFLTIVIPGTWYDEAYWRKQGVLERIGKTFGESAMLWTTNWKGGNSKEARMAAAKALAAYINGYKFKPGENLNIVAHSHGGNVAFESSHFINHKINNLVTIATPIRVDYSPKGGMVDNHVQVYSNHDYVQANGGGIASFGGAWRKTDIIDYAYFPETKVNNIDATRFTSRWPIASHSELWEKAPIWGQLIEPELKK